MSSADLRRIYLDNAATSWPKPEAVYAAVDRWQRENGSPAGRGTHDHAAATDNLVRQTRLSTARLLGVDDASSIVFTFNGTDALHLAIQGLISPGDHVVTTVVEHNSVLRPLRQLADQRGVAVTHVGCDDEGFVSPAEVLAAVNSRTKFVVVSHASNVTGAIQPVAEIGVELRSRGIAFVVDAAQTAGELPISVDELPCDLLAASGHKGLLGPLGTGILYVRPEIAARVRSIRTGGTGTQSHSVVHPAELPEKFESGNLNVPGIVGLGAGLKWIEAAGVEVVRKHAAGLISRLIDALGKLPGVRLYGPRDIERRTGLVSFTIEGYDPQEAAGILSGNYGIECRAGFHCAPLMHKALGTDAGGGTLRLSVGPFNTTDDIDAASRAVSEISAGA